MGKEVMGKKENEMAQEKERPAGSQSLFRGLMLIEILSNYPNGCPLAHLSELAGLNKSTVHRLLQGLQSCGYVTTAPAAGSYRLTTKFIAVGQKACMMAPCSGYSSFTMDSRSMAYSSASRTRLSFRSTLPSVAPL